MADEILNCDGTDPVHVPDWDNVVGNVTLDNGGYVGDILELSLAHIDEAFADGRLTGEEAGEVYSTAIVQAVSEAIKFELQEGKAKLELCYLQAQIDKLVCDCENDRCRAEADCALKGAQQAEIEYKTANVLPLEVEKLEEEIDLLQSKDSEEIARTIREDCKAESQCALDTQQIEKLVCDCANDTSMTDSKILLNSAQEEKLLCDCTNDTNMTDSKISLNAAQENKLACDCCNDSKRTESQAVLSKMQGELYERQKEGFNDNANQKIYDTQMNAWAMVFQDTDLEVVTHSIIDDNIQLSYDRIQERLFSAQGQSYSPIPMPPPEEDEE